jgi:energy-coupling factor transport system permease protein
MASVAGLRYLTIGQYVPGDSPIHRLDPRTKLVALAFLLAAGLATAKLATNLALFLVICALVGLARLPFRYLRSSIQPALPVILVLLALQVLFYPSAHRDPAGAGRMLISWGVLRVSAGGLWAASISLLRFINLLLLFGLLTGTTPTGALTQGLEHLLRPLSALGLPGHELAFVGAIALRFVPILGESLETILQAQASRSVRQEAGTRWRLARNAQRTAALVVPLFVEAYRRAEELSWAMQARCYRGGRGRTHLRTLVFASADYLALGLAACTVAGVILLQRLPLP